MLKSPESQTILVIEDEDDVRSFVCRVLELEGYCALQAENGLAGLKLTREKSGHGATGLAPALL